jgi:hypothetical protein
VKQRKTKAWVKLKVIFPNKSKRKVKLSFFLNNVRKRQMTQIKKDNAPGSSYMPEGLIILPKTPFVNVVKYT